VGKKSAADARERWFRHEGEREGDGGLRERVREGGFRLEGEREGGSGMRGERGRVATT
jgi:hypothetical protein